MASQIASLGYDFLLIKTVQLINQNRKQVLYLMPKVSMTLTPGAVFTGPHFLCNLRMSLISQTVWPWQVFSAHQSDISGDVKNFTNWSTLKWQTLGLTEASLGCQRMVVKNTLAYQSKQKIGFILNAQNLNDFDSRVCIRKTSFSSQLTNELISQNV